MANMHPPGVVLLCWRHLQNGYSTVAQCPGNTRQVLTLQRGDTFAGFQNSHPQHNGVDTSAFFSFSPCCLVLLYFSIQFPDSLFFILFQTHSSLSTCSYTTESLHHRISSCLQRRKNILTSFKHRTLTDFCTRLLQF